MTENAFQNNEWLFLRKEKVPEKLERVLDRFILEPGQLLLERCFFLKKGIHFFGTRFLPFFSGNIFH
jgi:hypothetical protein